MKSNWMKTLSIAAITGLFALSANASLMYVNDYYKPNRTNPNPDSVVKWMADELDIPEADLLFLVKVESTKDGLKACEDTYDLYPKRIMVTELDDDDPDAYVSWDLLGTDWALAGVFVKGGQTDRLYTVSDDQLQHSIAPQFVTLTKGGISHISFVGRKCDTPNVPDHGVTLALLGVAMCGIEAVRRLVRR